MAGFGNISASALLRQADATQKQMQTLEDNRQQFQWQQSFMTPQDYQQYQTYLQDRLNTLKDSASPADQEKAISYAKELMNTTNTFNANQRKVMSIHILEGSASEQDKLQLLGEQLQTALQQGADPTTVENLQSLYDSQAVKVTNQAQAAAAQGQANYDKSVTNAENLIMRGVAGTTDPKQMGLQQLQDAFNHGQVSAKDFAEQMTQRNLMLYQLYNSASQDSNLTPAQQSTFVSKFNELQKNGDFNKYVGQVGQDANGNIVPTSPMSQALASGQNVFKRVKDVNTGNWSLDVLPVVGKLPNGKNLYGIDNSKATQNGELTVNKGPGAGGPEGEKLFPENNGSGLYYYQDSTTGKYVEYDPNTGQRNLIEGTPKFSQNEQHKVQITGFDSPTKMVDQGHNPLLGNEAGSILYNAGHNIKSDLPSMKQALNIGVVQPASLIGAGAHNLLNNILHPANLLHPTQIDQHFQNLVAQASAHLSGRPSAQVAISPQPAQQPAYTKSILYTNPTPYPGAKPGTPNAEGNVVAQINKAVGLPKLSL